MIPGSPAAIRANMIDVHDNARFILIVESHAALHRLVEEKFCEHTPCVIVTARGFPDIATRCFLHKLHANFPLLRTRRLLDSCELHVRLTDVGV